MSSNKVILIGLDGADPDFITAHKDGLPTINYLIKNGVFGRLKSTIPPVTGAAWSTAMSGMNPGETGVTDFVEKDFIDEKQSLINSNSVRVNRIWNILGFNGKKVGIIGVPLTYPVERVNGFMISGFLTPSEAPDFTYPPDLKEELENVYRTSIEYTDYERKPDLFLKELYDSAEKKFNTAMRLLKKEWDFFAFVISETDWIQHFFAKHPIDPNFDKGQKTILEFFKFVDKFLGKMLENVDETVSILLISDHGFGKFVSRHVYLNTWLINEGYLFLRLSKKTRIKNILSQNLRPFSNIPLIWRLKDKIPKNAKDSIKNNILKVTELKSEDIDWSKTKAYSSHSFTNTGYIRINRKAVKEKEIPKLKYEIKNKLKDLTDLDGNQILNEIFYREELYKGDHLEKIPDIVYTFNPEYAPQDIISKKIVKEIPAKKRSEVGHTMHGIFIAKGPEIKKGFKYNAEIADIVPTIYHLMEVPLPENIDGKVLKEIFHPDSNAFKRPLKYRRYEEIKKSEVEWNKKDEEEVKERLRRLGYLD